ncbi:RNA polymerase sigma-70 factor [Catalinimonas sp. 4WD22]|uniref:RNA polymerase sigma factor n=1 Tax=Catalinimonas locisalis TaxID=3133978 RepID=UPI0031010F71
MIAISEKILFHQLKLGNESAFEQIYHLYKRPLFNFALRYIKDQALAEDALQEIFIKLWNNKENLDEKLSVKAFLFTCLKNHLLNVIRSEQKRIKYAALASSEKSVINNHTEEEVSYHDSIAIVEKGINSLSDQKKKIFRLKIIEGYSNQEIADSLGISEHTVRSQVSKSSKYMREFLNKAITILVSLNFFF